MACARALAALLERRRRRCATRRTCRPMLRIAGVPCRRGRKAILGVARSPRRSGPGIVGIVGHMRQLLTSAREYKGLESRNVNKCSMLCSLFVLRRCDGLREQAARLGERRGLGDQAVAGGFEAASSSSRNLARQTGRERVQELDDDRAGIAQEAAAGPVEAGVERERHAGKLQALIEGDVARLVVGRRRRAAGACPRGR